MVEQFVLGNAVIGQVRVQILLFQVNISRDYWNCKWVLVFYNVLSSKGVILLIPVHIY